MKSETALHPSTVLVTSTLIVLLLTSCTVGRWPVQGRVTSPYGLRWDGIIPDVHRGVDISVPTGTPVRSMAGGSVRFAGTMSGFGNVIWVDHGGELLSVYAHLSEIQVRVGQEVESEEVIGLTGASGDVTAPHLHFEVWKNGQEVDPVQMLGGLPRGS